MTAALDHASPAPAGVGRPARAPWLGAPTRHLFFTGKGGVGKTTVASATALHLAERGLRVLIVSTDPASNLDDTFAIQAGTAPTAVPGVPTLWVMNIDPEAAATAYREVARTTGAHVPEAMRALLPRLRDGRWTKMLLVTLAESTPVHEAERLQADLRRAGIEPFGWVVNASLAASGARHPLLAARAALEAPHLARVRDALASRAWLVPWRAE